jgi:hypothetical protein
MKLACSVDIIHHSNLTYKNNELIHLVEWEREREEKSALKATTVKHQT